mmetsp:Transcript_33416/g.73895  ORF Transcript_33416/g.73895 Transcript_33416/m.73895 type:complete len:450 (-) Transcript_33416:1182-2531(-)
MYAWCRCSNTPSIKCCRDMIGQVWCFWLLPCLQDLGELLELIAQLDQLLGPLLHAVTPRLQLGQSTCSCEHGHEVCVRACEEVQGHVQAHALLDRLQECSLEGGRRRLLRHAVTDLVEQALSAADDVLVAVTGPRARHAQVAATQCVDCSEGFLCTLAWRVVNESSRANPRIRARCSPLPVLPCQKAMLCRLQRRGRGCLRDTAVDGLHPLPSWMVPVEGLPFMHIILVGPCLVFLPGVLHIRQGSHQVHGELACGAVQVLLQLHARLILQLGQEGLVSRAQGSVEGNVWPQCVLAAAAGHGTFCSDLKHPPEHVAHAGTCRVQQWPQHITCSGPSNVLSSTAGCHEAVAPLVRQQHIGNAVGGHSCWEAQGMSCLLELIEAALKCSSTKQLQASVGRHHGGGYARPLGHSAGCPLLIAGHAMLLGVRVSGAIQQLLHIAPYHRHVAHP